MGAPIHMYACGCGRGRKGIVDLFDRIHRVEKAMSSAEAQNSAIQRVIQEEAGKVKGTDPNSKGKSPDK